MRPAVPERGSARSGRFLRLGLSRGGALIVGGAVALQYRVGERTLGLVMAFGSGVLISAVAFELVQEAWDKEGAHAGVGLACSRARSPSGPAMR